MVDVNNLAQHLTRLASITPTTDDAVLVLKLLDLTRLNPIDDTAAIATLVHQAEQLPYPIAAICIYPQFLSIVKNSNQRAFKIATVVNFPEGNQAIETTLEQINSALANGAQEIDMVFPYRDYLSGKESDAIDYVARCRKICGDSITVKVILESGAFNDLQQLYKASCDLIATGINFIKTSTGKSDIGATIESAYVMLTAIKDMHRQGYDVGFKASAGITTVRQALQYITLAQQILGPQWINPQHFRFGASALLEDVEFFLR